MSYQQALIEAAADFHRHEMGDDDLGDPALDAYEAKLIKLLGVENLDGDEDDEGFSIDSMVEAFEAGISAEDYANGVRVEGWASDIQKARAAKR